MADAPTSADRQRAAELLPEWEAFAEEGGDVPCKSADVVVQALRAFAGEPQKEDAC